MNNDKMRTIVGLDLASGPDQTVMLEIDCNKLMQARMQSNIDEMTKKTIEGMGVTSNMLGATSSLIAAPSNFTWDDIVKARSVLDPMPQPPVSKDIIVIDTVYPLHCYLFLYSKSKAGKRKQKVRRIYGWKKLIPDNESLIAQDTIYMNSCTKAKLDILLPALNCST